MNQGKYIFSQLMELVSAKSFQTIVIGVVEKAIETSRDEFEQAVFQNEVELLENIISNIKNK